MLRSVSALAGRGCFRQGGGTMNAKVVSAIPSLLFYLLLLGVTSGCQSSRPKEPVTTAAHRRSVEVVTPPATPAQAEAERRAVAQAQDLDALTEGSVQAEDFSRRAKFPEAEGAWRAVLKKQERALGPDHPDTLKAHYQLASALSGQRKYAEAELEYRAALRLMERVPPPGHRETGFCHSSLAFTLSCQHKYVDAEAEYRAALRIFQSVPGPEHPLIMNLRNNLVATLEGQGRHTEAEGELRSILAHDERVLGATSSATLISCRNLAMCLRVQGKKHEALVYARRALEGFQKTKGNQDQFTEASRKLIEDLERTQ